MTQPVTAYDIDAVKLEEITIVNASIENEEGVSVLNKDSGFDIQFKVTPGVNIAIKKVRIIFSCGIQAFKDESRVEKLNVKGNFEVSLIFGVDNLADLAKTTENGLVDVSPDLIAGLSNIAYGTSRGIIYTRCLGTVLGKIILPVISTPKLLGDSLLEP